MSPAQTLTLSPPLERLFLDPKCSAVKLAGIRNMQRPVYGFLADAAR